MKKLKGKIIDEDFQLLPGIEILSKDTVLLGMTNRDGSFEIDASANLNELLLAFIGMELTSVKINHDCQQLEMFMMADVIYDFIPIKRINKKRYKRFKNLAQKHQEAYEKGIFESRTPCHAYIFEEY